jgi:tetratricopeptide (TPR) repeat protein
MEPRTPQILLEQARKARLERRLSEARDLFREALELPMDGDADPRLVAELHAELAYVERALHDDEPAEAHYRKAAELFRALGEPLRTAHNMRHVADILRHQGRTAEADDLYCESIAIYRNSEDTPPLDLGNALRGYALLKEDTGSRREALELWQQVHPIYLQVGIDAGVAESQRRIDYLSVTAN